MRHPESMRTVPLALGTALTAALLAVPAAAQALPMPLPGASSIQVLPKPGDLFGDSQGLSPVKARISLMLDLLAGS